MFPLFFNNLMAAAPALSYTETYGVIFYFFLFFFFFS